MKLTSRFSATPVEAACQTVRGGNLPCCGPDDDPCGREDCPRTKAAQVNFDGESVTPGAEG